MWQWERDPDLPTAEGYRVLRGTDVKGVSGYSPLPHLGQRWNYL